MSLAVVMPTIEIRGKERQRAVDSVNVQTLLPDELHIQLDDSRRGSAFTRNAALRFVRADWVAFLDDDDEFLPIHLHELMQCAEATDADVVYPGCHVIGGTDPHDRFGEPFDADLLRQKSYIPVTSLVRMECVNEIIEKYGEAFFRPHGSDYDDWGFYLRLLDIGAVFVHHPVKTWNWHMHGYGMPGLPGNTSGLSSRW